MKRTVKLALTAAVLAVMGTSVGYAANVQPLNPPPADVSDPLYATPLAAFLTPPNLAAVRNARKNVIMPQQAALKPLEPQISIIVGGNVMSYVKTIMKTSLSDTANPTGIAQKIAPTF